MTKRERKTAIPLQEVLGFPEIKTMPGSVHLRYLTSEEIDGLMCQAPQISENQSLRPDSLHFFIRLAARNFLAINDTEGREWIFYESLSSGELGRHHDRREDIIGRPCARLGYTTSLPDKTEQRTKLAERIINGNIERARLDGIMDAVYIWGQWQPIPVVSEFPGEITNTAKALAEKTTGKYFSSRLRMTEALSLNFSVNMPAAFLMQEIDEISRRGQYAEHFLKKFCGYTDQDFRRLTKISLQNVSG